MSQPELSNNQFQPENICIETLDHHGITAGYCNKLKLAERIDARLPISKKHGAILNHGQRIKEWCQAKLCFRDRAMVSVLKR